MNKREKYVRKNYINKKFKLNIPVAVHIPLEICETCSFHCPNYGEDHSELNKRRKKIGTYIYEVGAFPVIFYDNPHRMTKQLGFILAEPNLKTTGHLIIPFILLTDSNEKGLLLMSVVDLEMEHMWIEELEKTGKINYFFNVSKNKK